MIKGLFLSKVLRKSIETIAQLSKCSKCVLTDYNTLDNASYVDKFFMKLY